ncbi:MAG: AAA family ATPase [Candidatus Lokiarchaeota archaeon]|nr:AAA family ATPase [Candidatus Lokiarchaeota archaeon]
MAKKKVLNRRVYLNSDNKLEPIEVTIEGEELTESDSEQETDETSQESNIQKILLKPVGYPIRLSEQASAQSDLEIDDYNLFQAYAQDQWVGLIVAVDEYLFDQMILPDFAFKIIKIIPESSRRVTVETEFEIVPSVDSQLKSMEKVGFADIIGNSRAIEKCKIIQEFMLHPEKFGRWSPKNVLFFGFPGTGKTLTARALASECGSQILVRKGTELIGLHVGDGANKIHTLFDKARKIVKKSGSAIIFIDEIDAIGLSRSYQSVRGDVIEVSTALLSEMDGLSENSGIITIAATNNIDLLDPGLRSRFEEEIDFELPDNSERVQMMQLFLSQIDVPYEISYQEVSNHLDGWSGRDIKEKLIKIAFHNVVLSKIEKITTHHLLEIIRNVRKKQDEGNAIFS